MSPSKPKEGQRIAKLLARAGIASRREIERMIVEGRVALDGVTLDTPATILTSLSGVTVDGEPVAPAEAARLFRYHKPTGLLTAANDPAGRLTIYDRLPEGLPRLMPVGRLDLNTEGLLLLTTDGELKRQLELPATGVERSYRARAYGPITQDQLEELIEGIEIEGIRYGSIDANLERRTGTNTWIQMRLKEGKNREVRRVLEHFELKVSRLIRTSYGPFELGDLAPGAVEEIPQHELVAFRKALKTPGGLPQPKDEPRTAATAPPPRAAPSVSRRGAGRNISSAAPRDDGPRVYVRSSGRRDGAIATPSFAAAARSEPARPARPLRRDGPVRSDAPRGDTPRPARAPDKRAEPGRPEFNRERPPRRDDRDASPHPPRPDRAAPRSDARPERPRPGFRAEGGPERRSRTDRPAPYADDRPERPRREGPGHFGAKRNEAARPDRGPRPDRNAPRDARPERPTRPSGFNPNRETGRPERPGQNRGPRIETGRPDRAPQRRDAPPKVSGAAPWVDAPDRPKPAPGTPRGPRPPRPTQQRTRTGAPGVTPPKPPRGRK
jgi:23S rRNA pseudouridine2605 synthase